MSQSQHAQSTVTLSVNDVYPMNGIGDNVPHPFWDILPDGNTVQPRKIDGTSTMQASDYMAVQHVLSVTMYNIMCFAYTPHVTMRLEAHDGSDKTDLIFEFGRPLSDAAADQLGVALEQSIPRHWSKVGVLQPIASNGHKLVFAGTDGEFAKLVVMYNDYIETLSETHSHGWVPVHSFE